MTRKHVIFDGLTGYITVPNNDSLNIGTSNFSLSFWAKDTFTADKIIMLKTSAGTGYAVQYNATTVPANKIRLHLIQGATERFIYGDIAKDSTEWKHICFVIDRSGDGVCYVNGVPGTPVNVSAMESSDLDNAGNLVLGNFGSAFMAGSLDDLRLYKEALTADEVAAIFNSGIPKVYTVLDTPTSGAAAAAWNCNEGDGTTITDEINGLVGTFSASGVSWPSELQLGILTDIEDWAIEVLTALTDDAGSDLFKTVDHWMGQIGLGESGIESFDKYAPFAFVEASLLHTKREGGYDANIRIELAVMLGQSSKEPYICRIGDATHVGTNRMFEKVLIALDMKRPPASTVKCDDFYITDVFKNLEMPKKHGIQPVFEANWIQVT